MFCCKTVSFATEIDLTDGDLVPACGKNDVFAEPFVYVAVHIAVPRTHLCQTHDKSGKKASACGDKAGSDRLAHFHSVLGILDAPFGTCMEGLAEECEVSKLIEFESCVAVTCPSGINTHKA